MAYGTTLTLPTVSGSHDDFPLLLVVDGTRNDLPADAYNGVNAFANGGGDFIAYTDSSKTTQLPVEIVKFVTGASPDIEVWIKMPAGNPAATSATIYVEADDVQTSQPAVTSTYGRDNVWTDYVRVYHLSDDADPVTDSTGNDDAFIGSPASASTSTDAPFGKGCIDLNTATQVAGIDNPIAGATSITLRAWSKSSNRGTGPAIMGAFLGNTNMSALLWVSGGEQLFFRTDNAPTGDPITVGPSTTLVGGTGWHLNTGRYDGAALDLFVDGTKEGASPAQTGTVQSPGSASFEIGRYNNNAGTRAELLKEAWVATKSFSDNYETTIYENQSATTAWVSNDGWAAAGGGADHVLLADDLNSASNLSTPSVAQGQSILADNLQSLSQVSSPSVSSSGTDALLADNLQSASNVSTPSVSQVHGILSDSLDSASNVSTPTAGIVDTTDVLIADNLQSTSNVTSPVVSQLQVLSADSLESTTTLSTPVAGSLPQIDGSGSSIINTNGGSLQVYFNGSDYFII